MGNVQNDAYDHEGGTPNPKNINWLKNLPDDIPINRISIPGTHDSGTYPGYGGDFAQCQVWNTTQQLEAGIRFLDVRGRHIGNSLVIHHASFYQHLTFGDIQQDIINFLNQNTSEVVIYRLKDEYTGENNTRTYSETVEESIKPFLSYYYLWDGQNLPILKDVRKKIILLRNFDSSDNKWIPWSYFKIQDNYDIGFGDEQEKWGYIYNQLIQSSKIETDSNAWYLNFISASGGNMPYVFARTLNKQLLDFFNQNPQKGYYGILPMDFPAVPLISKIIAFNPAPKIVPLLLAGATIESKEKSLRKTKPSISPDTPAARLTDEEIKLGQTGYIVIAELEHAKFPFAKFFKNEEDANKLYDEKNEEWSSQKGSYVVIYKILIHNGKIIKQEGKLTDGKYTKLFSPFIEKEKPVVSEPTESKKKGTKRKKGQKAANGTAKKGKQNKNKQVEGEVN